MELVCFPRNKSKDVCHKLVFDNHTIYFTDPYSNISMGHMGLTMEAFADSFKWFYKKFPHALEEIDTYTRIEEWCRDNGIPQREPTALELLWYSTRK